MLESGRRKALKKVPTRKLLESVKRDMRQISAAALPRKSKKPLQLS